MILSKLTKAYVAVEQFNEICGNLPEVNEASLDLQISLCYEEMVEVIDAFEQRDMKELAKEVADLWIVVAGLVQKMRHTGVDMGSVIEAVCEDNLDKFIPQGQPLQYDSAFTASLNQKFGRWVIKDSNGKVRKASTYKKADVSQYVLKDLFKEASHAL